MRFLFISVFVAVLFFSFTAPLFAQLPPPPPTLPLIPMGPGTPSPSSAPTAPTTGGTAPVVPPSTATPPPATTVVPHTTLGSAAPGTGSPDDVKYVLLETVGGSIKAGSSINLTTYISSAFNWLLGFAAVLAIVMLIVTGVAYTAAGVSEAGKSAAKAQLTGIMWGIGIALGAWLLLNIINPKLVAFNISSLTGYANDATPATGGGGAPAGGGTGGGSGGGGGGSGGTSVPSRPAPPPGTRSAAILNQAEASVGTLQTCDVPGTSGGRRGCAYAVNTIVERAIGSPAGGGLSTAGMYTAIKSNPNFVLVPGGLADSQPGDIVLSPTNVGENDIGHVGIRSTTGFIANSSRAGMVERRSTWNWPTTFVYRPI